MILFIFLCLTATTGVLAQANVKQMDENYGKTWTFYPDGDGRPQVAYLEEDPYEQNTIFSTKDIESKVHFNFYRKANSRTPKEINYDSTDDFLANFDSRLETKFIIHGWNSNSNSNAVQDIKDQYLERGDYNIFAVNWEELANNIYYFTPARQTEQVGGVVAGLIDKLVERGAKLSSIHLIGHSLGAHTCGYAGSMVKSGKVSRISGLDPALPYFELRGVDHRLDPSDAVFVDVIHTCAGLLGYLEHLGHVDFYPNGGNDPQPGCIGSNENHLACSHGRSHEFFAESINTKVGFYSYPCGAYPLFYFGACKTDPILMGDRVPSTAKGIYYLKTGSEKGSFAQGPIAD